MGAGWEDRAAEWLAWARTPGHDAYWRYRDAFFALVPPPRGRALEVGCGEGRVSRDLAARGHRMTAIDASPALLSAASEAHPDGEYSVASAEALPFPDASFALVVSYNVLMDVADMPRAVAEAGRVLEPGGRLCACITHPFTEAGTWEGDRFVVEGSYLSGGAFEGEIERAGLRMRFDGTAHALQDYSAALEAAGLRIEALREPAPPAGAPEAESWTRLPMFLMLRAVR